MKIPHNTQQYKSNQSKQTKANNTTLNLHKKYHTNKNNYEFIDKIHHDLPGRDTGTSSPITHILHIVTIFPRWLA
jgi:hypothetical protein